jgi:hypothetical protein
MNTSFDQNLLSSLSDSIYEGKKKFNSNFENLKENILFNGNGKDENLIEKTKIVNYLTEQIQSNYSFLSKIGINLQTNELKTKKIFFEKEEIEIDKEINISNIDKKQKKQILTLISQLLPYFEIIPEDIILRFNSDDKDPQKKKNEILKKKNDYKNKFPNMNKNIKR